MRQAVPEKKTDRNKELVADYESKKYTSAELIAKYMVSSTRIYQLLRKNGAVVQKKSLARNKAEHKN